MKPILIILVTILTAFSAHAKKLPGKIITDQGVSEVVFFVPRGSIPFEPDYHSMQYRIRYIDAKGHKKVLRPGQSREISFMYNDEEVRMLARKNTWEPGPKIRFNRNLFLKLEVDGNVKLFRNYYTESIHGPGNTSLIGQDEYTHYRHLVQRGDDDLRLMDALNFRNVMTTYFEDCPELAGRIDNRQLRRRDAVEIVQFYNRNCGYLGEATLNLP
jgi:hypothetical protein